MLAFSLDSAGEVERVAWALCRLAFQSRRRGGLRWSSIAELSAAFCGTAEQICATRLCVAAGGLLQANS